jgi:hypothetical protein
VIGHVIGRAALEGTDAAAGAAIEIPTSAERSVGAFKF